MKEIKLSEKDLNILKIISENGKCIGPTDIGLKLGISYNNASSHCSSSLGRLVKANKIIKQDGGKYVVK